MISHVHKDFWEFKVLVQDRNHGGVCPNKKVFKIQVIP
jgi:hypothetical protein